MTTFLGLLGSSALVVDGKEYGPCPACNAMIGMFAIGLDQNPPRHCPRCGKPWDVIQVTYGSPRKCPPAPPLPPLDPVESLRAARAVVDAQERERPGTDRRSVP